jgi:hypothetical protein
MKYKTVIDDGNVEFFFEKDYSEDLTKLSNASAIMDIIDSVRNPAKEICENPKNREHITTYIQTLCKLSEILNNLQE